MFVFTCNRCHRQLVAHDRDAGHAGTCPRCDQVTPIPSLLIFRCSHCGCKMSTNPARAGKKGKCPGCRRSMPVPTLTDPPPAGDTLPPATKPLRDARDVLGVLRSRGAELPPVVEQRPPAGTTANVGAAETSTGGPGLPHVPGFEILGELGRGGMGVVYKARQVGLPRLVALKMILTGSHASPEQLARFRSEAEAVARLNHPNIVQIYDIGEHQGLPYFALEFVEGGNLADQLDGKPQEPETAAERLQVLARAMHFAHREGIVHRDLKPANVLLTKEGTPKITDFGLAKQLDVPDDQTRSGAIMGTPSYMAPEQASGLTKEVGPLADVYSLGALLYEVLTGRPPFLGPTAWITVNQVLVMEPVPPRQFRPEIPRDLETICLKCLEKDPKKRYPSAEELAEELGRFLRQEPIRARPVSRPERFVRWCRREPWLASLSAAVLFTLVLGFAGVSWQLGETIRARRDQAYAQVDALLDADARAVPNIIDTFTHVRYWVDDRLREKLEAPELSPAQRDRVRLALLPVDPEQREPLRDHLLQAEPQELLILRNGLLPYKDELVPMLWTVVDDPRTDPDRRFRAAAVLAAYDADSERWGAAAPRLVDRFTAANPLHLGIWAEALRPVRAALRTPLVRAYHNRDSAERRTAAANILSNFAADDPDLLTELLFDADAPQYGILFQTLQPHRDRTLTLLRAELARTTPPRWGDEATPPPWPAPDAALVKQLEKGDGMLTERFALCQTLPLADFVAVAEGLRPAGYRPTRVRPYAAGKEVRVAAVWARDGLAWQLATGKSAGDIRSLDKKWQGAAYVPVDAAGYVATGKSGLLDQFAAVWFKPPVNDRPRQPQLRVDVPAQNLNDTYQVLKELRLNPFTLQDWRSSGGGYRFCTVWWEDDEIVDWKTRRGQNVVQYESDLTPDQILMDVNLTSYAAGQAPADDLKAQVTAADADLRRDPNDLVARLKRARAFLRLGEDAKAVEDLTVVLRLDPKQADAHESRAVAHARLRKREEALQDLAAFQKLAGDADRKAVTEAVVRTYLGEAAAALAELERLLQKKADDDVNSGDFTFQVGRVHALAAGLVQEQDAARAKTYADRAVALLRLAIKQDYSDHKEIETSPDLAALREHPDFQKLRGQLGLAQQYAGVWHATGRFHAEELHGLTPAEHLQRCRKLASDGWRPHAHSVVWFGADVAPSAASVWHRPVPADEAKEILAKRQANAAVALLRLGQGEAVWPLLEHRPDPRLRSYIIHRLSPLGADPENLVKRLHEETNVSVRRALILSLGEFTEEQLPAARRQPLVNEMLLAYRDDNDPGIHSAAEWLLRQWGQKELLARADEQIRTQPSSAERLWYVTGQGQTMVIIPGPVEFLMGSPLSEGDRDDDELLHRRRISRTFAIATKPVTVEQYRRYWPQFNYMARHSPEKDCPINYVGWYAAAHYCRWLSEMEGIPESEMCFPPHSKIGANMQLPDDYLQRTGYRMPTEAEWEYACRAGAVTMRPYGQTDELLPRYEWYFANSQKRTWPSGTLKPNDLGLFDCLGNIRQWCQEWKLPYPVAGRRVVEDDVERRSGTAHPYRGNAFSDVPLFMRLADRHAETDNYFYQNGFRIARTYVGEKDIDSLGRLLAKQPENGDLWFRRGRAYAVLGRWKEAAADYTRATEKKPGDARFWYQRGLAHMELKQWDEAVAALSRSLQLDRTSVPALRKRAEVYRQLNQHDKAVADYTMALELRPDDGQVYWARSLAYSSLQQWDKALADLNKSIDLNVYDWRSFLYRGRLYNQFNQTDKALADYDKAIALHADDASLWRERGLIHKNVGQLAKARDDFARAVELDDTDESSWRNLGVVHAQLGQWENAVVNMDRAIVLAPKSALNLAIRGFAHQKLGNRTQALADLDQVVVLGSKDASVWYLCALAYQPLGMWEQARACYAKAVELNPKASDYWYALANGHLERKEWKEAVKNFSKALELQPKLAEAWNGRGEANRNLGQLDQALEDHSRAIQLQPGNAAYWNNRGMVRDEKQQWKEALADYSQAVKLSPSQALYWSNRGRAYAKLGQLDRAVADFNEAAKRRPDTFSSRTPSKSQVAEAEKAVAEYTEAIRRQPDEAAYWFARGDAYHQLGKLEKSLADFDRAIQLKPKQDVFYAGRAAVYADQQEWKKAAADLDEAIRLKPDEASHWYHRGLLQAQRTRYDPALADFSRAIELKPAQAEFWYGRGTTYSALGQADKALTDLNRAIELKADQAEYHDSRAAVRRQLGQMVEALADHTRAIELKPERADFWDHRGRTHYEQEEWDKALADFGKAVERKGDEALFWYNRARAYNKLSRWKEAVDDCTKALSLQADYLDALTLRAEAYKSLADYAKALADYSKALELKPDDAALWNLRGITHYNAGNSEKAVADYSEAIRRDKDNAVYWSNRGLAHAILGQQDKALADCTKATELAPRVPDHWNTRANVYHYLGKHEEAVADYTKAIELAPDTYTYVENRANSYQQLRQWDKALADRTRVVELLPKDSESRNLRGLTYFAKGDLDRAIADFDEAIRLQPAQAMFWHNRADAYLNQGKLRNGLADLNKAIELQPANAEFLNLRGATHNRLGDRDKALADFSKAIELNPAVPLYWRNRGALFALLGKWDEAATNYAKVIELKDPQVDDWSEALLVHLQRKDSAGHRKTCKLLLEQFGATTEPSVAYRVLQVCLRVPDALDDLTALQPLLERLTRPEDRARLARVRGQLEFRRGRFKEAIQQLTEAVQAHGKGGEIQDGFFLALAHARLGDTAEARTLLDQANRQLAKEAEELAKSGDRGSAPFWKQQEWQLLARQAEEAVKLTPP